LLKVFFEQPLWFHEVVVVKIAPLVVPEGFIFAAPQKLEAEEAFVRLLVTAVKQLLGAIA